MSCSEPIYGFLIKNGSVHDVNMDGIPPELSFRKLKQQADFQQVKCGFFLLIICQPGFNAEFSLGIDNFAFTSDF